MKRNGGATCSGIYRTRFNELFIAPSLNEKSKSCSADFSGCTFSKQAYFDNSIFKSIVFKNTVFKEVVSFNNTKFHSVNYQRTLFEKFADFADTKYPQADRESFRLIKSELLKVNNRVESLYYQSQELIQYEKSLRFLDNPFEKAILFLNRISNDHGLNWAKGIWFTFYISVFSYTIYLLILPCKPFGWGFVSTKSFLDAADNNLKYYFQFITVIRNFDFIKSACPNSISYIVDFVSRIFIGYGIYQTIQAFRKYGKH